jgi:hypothetical protein
MSLVRKVINRIAPLAIPVDRAHNSYQTNLIHIGGYMEIQQDTVTQDPATGTQQATRVVQEVASPAAAQEAHGIKANSVIWYVVGVINTLLVIRILLLVLGANDTGFASFMYSLTHVFVAPFLGIFASPVSGNSYFEIASVLAIIIYSLVGWGIASLVSIKTERTTQA